VGTTVEEEAGFDLQPTVAGVLDILNKAQEIVPGIKELPLLNMEAGLRPTSPERLPVLGPTEINGLIMASGGHSYGILLAPVVAQTITYLVLTGQLQVPLTFADFVALIH
jgi:glycine oxidase